eukprot:Plantae.Rhodophyta-Purpureofilum_apyrenoidigerum.ctg16082.p1 GENE.Plantae.Rhodophyta-Purpureofilum_apyrenoidigerum.ctg16082~~Plantae.Rhodophyta-Purpureofilum_apyrenoidigerum.ctg16082.p1  ORF type:complete len:133 (-),score=13.38 Plantae.Rhodophyta-Purpureofilum_apyrenoidigerum.ctg16082:877-1275(-)
MDGEEEYDQASQPLDVLIHASSLLAERAQEVKGSNGTRENAYICNAKNCGRTFTKKWNLKVHIRLHTGDTPFTCRHESCKKTFRWRSSLKSHEKTHENSSAKRRGGEAQPSIPKGIENPTVVAVNGDQKSAS